MKGVYLTLFEAVATTAATDLFEFTAATGRGLELLEFGVYQTTEVATNVAEEEFLTLRVRHVASGFTSGSGGSTFTPGPLEQNGGTAGFTCEINNTTQASGGSIATKYSQGWNIRQPFEKVWTPETLISCAGAAGLVITMTAPADSVTLSGYAYVRELG